MTIHRRMLAASAVTLLVACGGSQGTRPDDMSAEEHRRAAAEEDAASQGHESQYDEDARQQMGPANASPDLLYGLADYNPTEGHRASAQRHQDLAAEHRAAAAALETFEEQECSRFPPETRAVCPMLGQVAAVEDVPGGVRLRLSDDANAAAVADHIRCHLAYARTQGREGMDHCPLYVDGATVDTSDGITLTTSSGDAAVRELRRRAHAHVP